MPSPPIRRSRAARSARDAVAGGATRAELDAVHLAVEDFKARMEPVPGRLAQATRAIDAQHKRLEALAAGLENTAGAVQALRADLAAAAPPVVRRRLARAMELLGALRRQQRPTPPAVNEASPPPVSTKLDWVLSGGRANPQARAVMVALLGLSPSEIDGVVAKLATAAEPAPSVVRVFLTDSSAFEPFRARGLPFEYLPPAPPATAQRGPRDWSVYRLRRFALLCDKWQPVEVVGFGPAATAQLAEWQASPLLPETVRQLLAVADESPAAAPRA